MKTMLKPILLATAFLWVFGCGSTQPESRLQKGLDSLGLQAAHIRLINTGRATRIPLRIEAAADSILRASDDPVVRKNAHRWKIYTPSIFRQALLFPDAGAGTLDAWAFAIQIRQYFTEGDGKSLFGEHQAIAVKTAREIESLFEEVGQAEEAALNRYRQLQSTLDDWARSHPIVSPSYERPSIIPYLKEFQIDIDHGLTGTVGDIAVDLRSLTTRIDLLAAQLPREARWQAEYLLAELEVDPRLGKVEADISAITESVAKLTELIERGDLTIDIKALRSLHADLQQLEGLIATERELILAEIQRQRTESLAHLDQLSGQVVEQATAGALQVIDHLLLRVVLILVACAVIAMILMIVYRRTNRKGMA